MKYKYLTSKSSTFKLRLIVAFVVIVSICLLVNAAQNGDLFPVFFILLGSSICIFIFSRFSIVKYDSENVVISNLYGDSTYSRRELREIRAMTKFLDIYLMKFNNGKSHFFAIDSRIGLVGNPTKNAFKMQKEIKINYNYQDILELIMQEVRNNHPDELKELEDIRDYTCSSSESLMATTHLLLGMKTKVTSETWNRIIHLKEYCHSVGLLVKFNP